MYGDRRGAYRFLVGRPERSRQFGRPKRKQENNIKMDLEQSGMGRHGLDCSGSGEGQMTVNSVVNLRVP